MKLDDTIVNFSMYYFEVQFCYCELIGIYFVISVVQYYVETLFSNFSNQDFKRNFGSEYSWNQNLEAILA